MTPVPESPFSIAIADVGAGLVLTRVLQLHGVTMSVFERESVSISCTGTSLVVLPEAEQYTLGTVQLVAQLRKITLPSRQRVKINGQALYSGV